MQTLIISLPDDLKKFMDEQIARGLFKNHSDYFQTLLTEDKMVQVATDELVEHLKETGEADHKYIESLREHVRNIAER